MATPDELCRDGELIEVEVALRPGEEVFRRVYLTPEAGEWIETKCSKEGRGYKFPDYFYLRNVVKDLSTSKIKYPTEGHPCLPKKDGIFELKGGRARLFGYFPDKQTFVGVCGAEAEKDIFHRDLKTYDPYIRKAKKFQVDNGHMALTQDQLDAFV